MTIELSSCYEPVIVRIALNWARSNRVISFIIKHDLDTPWPLSSFSDTLPVIAINPSYSNTLKQGNHQQWDGNGIVVKHLKDVKTGARNHGQAKQEKDHSNNQCQYFLPHFRENLQFHYGANGCFQGTKLTVDSKKDQHEKEENGPERWHIHEQNSIRKRHECEAWTWSNLLTSNKKTNKQIHTDHVNSLLSLKSATALTWRLVEKFNQLVMIVIWVRKRD